jgi:hypothetical protein
MAAEAETGAVVAEPASDEGPTVGPDRDDVGESPRCHVAPRPLFAELGCALSAARLFARHSRSKQVRRWFRSPARELAGNWSRIHRAAVTTWHYVQALAHR